MKKFFFIAAALTGLLAVSCNKEKEIAVSTDLVKGSTHTVSIKATIAPETRTSYADDKTFSWVKNDSIIVVTLSPDEDYIRLTTFYAESSGAETVFTGEVEDGYSLYNLAFYTAAGSGVAFGQDDDNNIYFYLPSFTAIDGDPVEEYTVASSNPLANLPLMGVQQDDNSYVFYTATGAAKFSFTDVPEGAAYFAVEMSEEPISGYFTWDDEGVITNDSAREGTYTYTGTDGQEHTARYANGYVVYHFDRKADGTGEIYMPLPVGRIPAGATVSFYDEDLEEALYTRTIRSDIPIERNRVTEVAAFSAKTTEWVSIGEGAYYDLLPFYFMNSDVNTFVGVEFFKNESRPGVYRIENPYPYAAEDREYTIPDAYLPLPEYVEFTILKDNSVVYDDIHTGYNESDNVSDGAGDWFLACPSNWGDDNTYNFVAKYHEDGTPDLVVLSPLYLYQYGNSYYYAYSSTTWKNMWVTIYFPGCDLENQYDLYCSVELTEIADDNPAQPLGKVDVELGESFVGGYLVIAKDKAAAEEMFAAGLGTEIAEGGTYTAPFPADAPSGEYYVFLKTIPAEGFTDKCALIFDSEDPFDYFRSDEDLQLTLDDVLGSYTGNNYYRTASAGWTSGPVDLTFTIEESDDPLSGYDIMFTDLCPEIAKALAGRGGTATAIPVYASFETAHGIVTIPAGQPAYTIKPRIGAEYTVTVSDFTNDITLYWKEDGTLQNKTNICMYNGSENVGNTNRNTTFYRNGSKNNAPARVSRRGYGLKPFNAVEVDYSRYEGLDKNAIGRLQFTGVREKTFRK